MRRAAFCGLCLLLAVAFAALGLWQLERLSWKHDLITRVDARVAAPAIPAPPRGTAINRADHEYRRVVATGVFRHDLESRVQAVTEQGPGWWVVTPLEGASGAVLINRGFVPTDRADPSTRVAGNPEGLVTVTGLLRLTEPDGGFLRANDAAAGRWYSRDVAAISRARGLTGAAPYFIDADATANRGGLPIGGLTVIAFRNAHLVYALTWFGLSALCLFGLALACRPSRRTGV